MVLALFSPPTFAPFVVPSTTVPLTPHTSLETLYRHVDVLVGAGLAAELHERLAAQLDAHLRAVGAAVAASPSLLAAAAAVAAAWSAHEVRRLRGALPLRALLTLARNVTRELIV